MHFSFQAFRHRLLTPPSSKGFPHRLCAGERQRSSSLISLHADPQQRLRDQNQLLAVAVLQSQEALATGSAGGRNCDRKGLTIHETSPSAQNAARVADQHAHLPHKHGLEDGATADGDAASSAPQQEAKRKKPLPPTPAIVGKGSAFTQEVWQNAALLVDKPKGWTSFDVCAKLRGALKTKKIGHAGTLDPMATGLLIICTGKGTKAIDGFVAMEKAYSGTLRLGQTTPSYDAETDVSEALPWEHIEDEDIEVAKKALVGPIMQQPPMYSAVSIKGERLYKAARRGEEVERPARPVTVHSFELQRSSADMQDMYFRISCSKGTYIRSLAHDLGQALGCGAHLTTLRRERIGEHDATDAWALAELLGSAEKAYEAAL